MNKYLNFTRFVVVVLVLFFSIPLIAKRSGGRSGARSFSSRKSSSSNSYSRSSSYNSASSYSRTKKKGMGYYDPNKRIYYNSDIETKTKQDAEDFADIVIIVAVLIVIFVVFYIIKDKLTQKTMFKMSFSKKHNNILKLNEKIKEELKESVVDNYINPKALKSILDIILENKENINIENIEFVNEKNYNKHKNDSNREKSLLENIRQNNIGNDDLITIIVTIPKHYSPKYDKNNDLNLIQTLNNLAQEAILPDKSDKIYTSFIALVENVEKTALFG